MSLIYNVVTKTKIFTWIVTLLFLLLVQGQLNRKEKKQIQGENLFFVSTVVVHTSYYSVTYTMNNYDNF